jgi:simple sugar transport system permease protein
VSRTITLERRIDVPRWTTIVLPFASALVAFLITGVVLLLAGQDPVAAYRDMAEAALTDNGALTATLVSATPLILTGLAAAIAFRMSIWNIGGEGQLYAGAIAATAAALLVGSSGFAVAFPVMVLAGFAGGAVWGAIPGLLRAHLNTSEILTSLMLNYIGGLLMLYLIFDSDSYWRDLTSPSAKVFPQGKQIDPSAYWPGFVNGELVTPLGLLVGIGAAVILFVLLRSSRFGFRLRVIADSPDVGRYAGMRTKRSIVNVMIISGGLAGLAGASQVGDFSHLIDPKGLQQGAYGYTGIVVAALARYNPLGVVVAAVALGALTNAGFKLQGPDFPLGLVGTLEGIILFCVLSGETLRRYRLRIGPPRPQRSAAPDDLPDPTGLDTPPTETPA